MKTLPTLALLLLAATGACRAEPFSFPLIIAPLTPAPAGPTLAPLNLTPLPLQGAPAATAAPAPSNSVAAVPAPAH